MTDLPRDVHAAFYHCAALTVHPSIFEGGLGPFPFYESVSVGTPCLFADGPHVREFVGHEPMLTPYVFDPNDVAGLRALVVSTLANREGALADQAEVLKNLSGYGWKDVAAAYAQAAIEPSLRVRSGNVSEVR